MKKKNKGLSLIEIIVATLIMAITMAGLVNLFVSGKRWLLHSRARMTGGEFGKYFLDPYYQSVQESDWNNGTVDYNTPGLQITPSETAGAQVNDQQGGRNIGLGRSFYQPFYTVNTMPGVSHDTQARKVKVRIYWPDT